MGAVLLLLALVAVLELARRSHVLAAFAALGACGRRALRVMRRPGASDHSRERASGLLARRLFATALAAAARLALVAAPLLVLLGLDSVLSLGVRHAFFDWRQRLVVLALVLAWGWLRRRMGRDRRLQLL